MSLRVNGTSILIRVSPENTLLHLLRDRLRLTGAKESYGAVLTTARMRSARRVGHASASVGGEP